MRESLIQISRECTSIAVGTLLFGISLVHMGLSVLINMVKATLSLKRLIEFREHEHDALDVHSPTQVPQGAIPVLGSLPMTVGHKTTFTLPEAPTHPVAEILLEATHNDIDTLQGSPIELEYCLYSASQKGHVEYFYVFFRPFSDLPDHALKSVRIWYPIPNDEQIVVRLVDCQSSPNRQIGDVLLQVIGWR